MKAAKSKEECTIVKKIDTVFGSRSAIVTAFVYDSPETMTRVEPKKKEKKQKAKK